MTESFQVSRSTMGEHVPDYNLIEIWVGYILRLLENSLCSATPITGKKGEARAETRTRSLLAFAFFLFTFDTLYKFYCFRVSRVR